MKPLPRELLRRSIRPWTTAELRTLREMAPTHNFRQIAAALGRPYSSVQKFASRKGIRVHKWAGRECKVSPQQAVAIRRYVASGVPRKTVARGMGICKWYVGQIVNGKRRAA